MIDGLQLQLNIDPDTKHSIYNSPLEAYNYTLREVTPGGLPLEALTLERIRSTGKCFAMDAMAPTHTLAQLPNLTGGLAIGNGDLRSSAEVIRDLDWNIGYIKNDIRNPETWDTVDYWRENQETDGLDIALFRPFGGLKGFHPEEVFEVLTNIYNRLSKNGGIMLGHIQHEDTDLWRGINDWINYNKQSKKRPTNKLVAETKIIKDRGFFFRLERHGEQSIIDGLFST